jgi:hypothetical protein
MANSPLVAIGDRVAQPGSMPFHAKLGLQLNRAKCLINEEPSLAVNLNWGILSKTF